MSSYCVSDVHGNLWALEKMLKKIDFKYDGTDSLFVLGDMVDWGSQSIETLLFCKELDEKYDFITILMGNHDYMMLTCIELSKSDNKSEIIRWENNGGEETLEGYLKLDKNIQKSIKNWLHTLKYYVSDLEIGGIKFYLTHSRPYEEKFERKYQNSLEQMVWKRIEYYDNPMKSLLKNEETLLINGHTTTKDYQKLDVHGKCRIYIGLENQHIGIDCGCKAFKTFRKFGRLACLRLDDFKEFYINEEDINE